ncbi:MAG: hypothetical protein AAGG01_14495, partial [Planctomycetota bacterium]
MRPLQLAAGWLRSAGPKEVTRALVAWLLLATGFMLFPFRFDYQGPKRVTNGAVSVPGDGFRFDSPSRLRTTAPPVWVAPAISAGKLDVELEVTPASANERGPARIVTLSTDRLRRNFMVAQKGVDLLVRARRPGADENGAPPLKVDGVFETPQRVSIDVRFRERMIE